MSKRNATARRVRVERNIYRRPTGVFEVGLKDGAGVQRWHTVEGGITAARALRHELLASRARGERVAPNPRLRFGDAADRWLTGPVTDLRDSTQAGYRNAVERHLRPRYATRRLDGIDAEDLAALVRELRTEGKSEATIAVVLGVTARIYKYAARRLGWAGSIPTTHMLASERPKLSHAQRRPIFEGAQLEQTIAAAHGPYRTMFTLAALTGARISELCGLTWANVRIHDLDDAEIEFGWQVDRKGNRGPSKTDGSARTVPIPPELAFILERHQRAEPRHPPRGPRVRHPHWPTAGPAQRRSRSESCPDTRAGRAGPPDVPDPARARSAGASGGRPSRCGSFDALVPPHGCKPRAARGRVRR